MDKKKIISDFYSGKRLIDISREFEISIDDILFLLSVHMIDNREHVRKKREISKVEELIIQDLLKYISNKEKLSIITGISVRTLSAYIVRNVNGLPYNGKRIAKRIVNRIRENYIDSSYDEMRKLSIKIKIDLNTLCEIIRDLGIDDSIEIYSKKLSSCPYRDNYFTELNDAKAFILGLIFSVANICSDSDGSEYFTLIKHSNEDDIIKTITSAICIEEKISYYKISNSTCCKIYSKGILKDIKRYGLEGKINIPKEYEDSFMEGMFISSLNVNPRNIVLVLKHKSYKEFCERYISDKIHKKINSDLSISIRIRSLKYIHMIADAIPVVKDIILDSKNREALRFY